MMGSLEQDSVSGFVSRSVCLLPCSQLLVDKDCQNVNLYHVYRCRNVKPLSTDDSVVFDLYIPWLVSSASINDSQ